MRRDKTNTQRQRAYRERLARHGMRPRQVIAHDDDWPQIRDLAERLKRARMPDDA